MLGDSIDNSSKRNIIELDLGENQDTELCRVATIDIGTNSTHLLIAKLEPKLNTFSIELAEKSTTRLGERDPGNGELTSIAMTRAFSTLKRFKEREKRLSLREEVFKSEISKFIVIYEKEKN